MRNGVRANGRRGGDAEGKHRDVTAIVQGLRRIVHELHSYSQGVRARYGLTGPQLWAVKTLQGAGPIAVGALAEALAVHQSSVSVLLDRLEERGLVTRRRRDTDQRVVDVELTPRGVAMAADAPEAAQGRLLHALDAMSATEVHALSAAVRRLVAAMEAADVHAEFFFADG
jgi:DNA-binding MarR family transcriptional regulator